MKFCFQKWRGVWPCGGRKFCCTPPQKFSARGDRRRTSLKIARAVENAVYVVSANTAGITESPIPGSSTDGGSQIVDYRGLVLADTGPGESMAAFSEIDLASLRRFRRRPGLNNLLARQRPELYVECYRQAQMYPPNTMMEGKADRQHFIQTQRDTIEQLAKSGVI